MKSGYIEKYQLLSEFKTVKEFNEHIWRFLDDHRTAFSKSELIAFHQLTKYSVKVIGVCNAKIGTLVSASHKEKGGISRSTFERMLRKAKKLGILSVHHALRQKGGYAHNVFVFHRYDAPLEENMKDRPTPEIPCPISETEAKSEPETTSFLETNSIKTIKNEYIRKEKAPSLTELDETYLPDYIPEAFVNCVKPFFPEATNIYTFWKKARLAYHQFEFNSPLELMVATVIKAFKTTVWQYKRKKIKTTFVQYFYGTLYGLFRVERRRERRRELSSLWPFNYNWLEAEG
ncbi:hypothetical protein WD019_15825 [Fictibacillus sp. Mic-4]|uniref:hypothetical protein n=1 Tax=Fictibacillus sp. Mic-4 TaxID=3132826 RepID=UPI002D01B0A9|nr:hypothetical protein [Bacillus sp. (in: firmicutes)]